MIRITRNVFSPPSHRCLIGPGKHTNDPIFCANASPTIYMRPFADSTSQSKAIIAADMNFNTRFIELANLASEEDKSRQRFDRLVRMRRAASPSKIRRIHRQIWTALVALIYFLARFLAFICVSCARKEEARYSQR